MTIFRLNFLLKVGQMKVCQNPSFISTDAFLNNIVACWPGSTHDLRIFENSKIADKLRDGALDGILVGDSGCACRAYLLTPILTPKNAGKVRYNTAYKSQYHGRNVFL